MNKNFYFAPVILCGLVACVPGTTLPLGAADSPPPSGPEIEKALQLFVDRGLSGNSGYWLITKAEMTGKATWNSAYTDHWPKEADKAPFIQGFRPLNGWEVTVHAQPKSMKESRGTSPKIFQVLIDKDRVIHWCNTWQGLPSGLQNLGS